MAPCCSVEAAQVIFDEIDRSVSETVKMHTDEPIWYNLLSPNPTDTEEQPFLNDDNQSDEEEMHQNEEPDEEQNQEEDTIQNPKPDEKEIVSDKKQTSEPKQVKTTQQDEHNLTETTSDEEYSKKDNDIPQPEQTPSFADLLKTKFSKIFEVLSEFFNQCGRVCSDKITVLKEKWNLSQNQPSDELTGEQAEEELIVNINPKEFVPYYFLNPEPINDVLPKTFFRKKVADPKAYLPYSYLTQYYEIKDIEAPENAVTSEGTDDFRILMNAPSPKIEVVGKQLYAKLVIDVRNNTLYKYDEKGLPLKAYLVATGARGSRTKTGLRIVTYKEKFPYKGAPKNTKRIYDPYSYGPYIIFMNAVNPKTGKQRYIDQFLHGNRNERTIGKKVSHGCMRTNNNVMKHELSKEVKRGDYVLIINPDVR